MPGSLIVTTRSIVNFGMKRDNVVDVLLFPLVSNPWIDSKVGVNTGIAELIGQKRSFLRFSTEVLLGKTSLGKSPDLNVTIGSGTIFSKQGLKESNRGFHKLFFVLYKGWLIHCSDPPLAKSAFRFEGTLSASSATERNHSAMEISCWSVISFIWSYTAGSIEMLTGRVCLAFRMDAPP
jgi:hypothetical protein